MSFTINNELSFIDSFQFLSSSLESLVKNLAKDDFNYLSLKSDLAQQGEFYPDE